MCGTTGGQSVLVLGTGMGGPATVRSVRALAALGVGIFVRAGGAGPVQPGMDVGTLVVATAAVRQEGASHHFLPPTWPAVADPEVVTSLRGAATRFSIPCRVGVVQSKDSFFGEIDPANSPVQQRLVERWTAWQRLGVLASEMEAGALFAVAAHLGLRAGAVLRVNDVHQETGEVSDSEAVLCQVAITGAAGAVGDD